jgi:hypothetical protein
MTVPRSRDLAGRARNARPRDPLGRPLPYGEAGTARVPDDLVLPPDQAVPAARGFLDEGMPFHAHEIFEGTWKAAPDEERELWRALAQLCVGMTHALRGNTAGAQALVARAHTNLAPYDGQTPYGIDVSAIRTQAAQWLSAPDGPLDVTI